MNTAENDQNRSKSTEINRNLKSMKIDRNRSKTVNIDKLTLKLNLSTDI